MRPTNKTNSLIHHRSCAGSLSLSLLLCIATSTVLAGEADVLDASIRALGNNQFRINATVRHDDTGWEHYADRWDVLDTDGQVLGSRTLLHPHENEQPFTRSLTLNLPQGTRRIILQANDTVHGLGGQQFELAVPVPSDN